MAIEVVRPPKVTDIEGSILFLAGPIQGAKDWQSDAIDIVSETASGITIASPRKEYAEGEFVYEKQVDWETEHLRRAAECGIIMFWLACQHEPGPQDIHGNYRSYAQTSRFELAEAKMKHERDGANLVVGIEEGFGNARYIKRRLSQDCPEVPILDNLEETCHIAAKIAERVKADI